ncbi:MAG: HAD-IC family P-type ATPase, partial [Propionibacterium sp.]|nr:HAD-IC family P-type ATPase [Propionibacterium sp.]
MATAAPTSWHALDTDEVRAHFETAEGGITEAEARARMERHGPNEIEERPPDTWYEVLLRQFRSPMIIFLIVAATITGLLGEWFDTVVIVITLLLNASLGFWQERKSERDVRALRQLTVAEAQVVRDDTISVIPARELVPGDEVRLESGDKVPADLRLTDVVGLEVNESMLTGEVLPTTKRADAVAEDTTLGDRHSMAYSGTLVASGRATGVVVGTGTDTELGAIAQSVQEEGQKTPLQMLTDRLEKHIAVATVVIAGTISIASIVMGTPVSDAFRGLVALIVSALPEALPIVLTVALGVGVSRMAKHNAVIRSLPSVETLGSTDIIGSDKTGTLTINRMTVEHLWTPDGVELDVSSADGEPPALSAVQRRSLRTGALSNESLHDPDVEDELVGNAVDVAMAAAGLRTGALTIEEHGAPPAAAIPYESANKYSQAIYRDGDRHVMHIKGAPETVMEFCTTMDSPDGPRPLDGASIREANLALAGRGSRVIATASVEVPEPVPGEPLPEPEGLVFTGLQAMMDPPREGVKQAIADCRSAGIQVMMITGDHPATAVAIGERLGLRTDFHPLTGTEMAQLGDLELRDRLKETSVAARMTPRDKLRIVKVLQADDKIVAVTGDGVNDAPALKAASVGVAMGESVTDVARD